MWCSLYRLGNSEERLPERREAGRTIASASFWINFSSHIKIHGSLSLEQQTQKRRREGRWNEGRTSLMERDITPGGVTLSWEKRQQCWAQLMPLAWLSGGGFESAGNPSGQSFTEHRERSGAEWSGDRGRQTGGWWRGMWGCNVSLSQTSTH